MNRPVPASPDDHSSHAAPSLPQSPSQSAADTVALVGVSAGDPHALMAALAAALQGGPAVLPIASGAEDAAAEILAEHPRVPQGTALVVRTSGSSGVPKSVVLTGKALRASAAATEQRFGGASQWLVALPLHLISGIQMLTRSILAGTQPVFLPSVFGGSFEEDALLRAAAELSHERRSVSLVPVQLRRMLIRAEADPVALDTLRRFDQILVGGQATPRADRQRAHELGLELRRSYGMTETAGGCVYDGVENGDTLVRIRGGEVQLAGPSLAVGYLGDAEQTAARFLLEEGVRWYRTGDAGELLGGMLTVTGRLDRVIISGGMNVSLDELERVTRQLPGYEEAVALGQPDAVWGERPTLAVPGADGHGSSEAPAPELVAAVKRELGLAAVPAAVRRVPTIPQLSGGKPDLVGLRAQLGLTG